MKTQRAVMFAAVLLLASCDKEPATPPGVQAGRWVIVHSPQVERDTVLLDTATGNTWGLVLTGRDQNSPYGWQFIGKLDGPGGSTANRPAATSAPPASPPAREKFTLTPAPKGSDQFNQGDNSEASAAD